MKTENQKLKEAIEILRNAQSENEVQDAIDIKEELSWKDIDEELKDEWYEAFGDVKHYHPEEICFMECTSCNKDFDLETMEEDSDSNYFCKECYEELAPVMKAEYDELVANGEIDIEE